MAWYAELKRRKWYCINGFNMISWYSQYLYDEWYNSLTDEQKEHLAEVRRKQKEKRDRELQNSVMRLMMMTGFISGAYRNINEEKYHGIYDENGFPKI